jgi:methyl-accepting chemotaxis protein
MRLAQETANPKENYQGGSTPMIKVINKVQDFADNANQANNLMTNINKAIEEANQSIGKVINSMDDISKASEETSKIKNTIDEIAFQTNLLALNAAVEAARAGEAGAVIEDEVKNLEMRAADAGKNTAELI